ADDATSVEAIHAALNAGITFFDTADIYGLGHSEELLGKTISEDSNVVIATKVGNVSRNNQFTTDYTKEYMLDACEKSLRRLKRDTIDYYQLHTAKLSDLKNGACIEAMQQLQQEGKIRYWGLSLNTFEPDPEAQYLLEHKMGNGFQLVLNLINQKSLQLIRQSAADGYGIIARMPLQFGLLTGKFSAESTFADNDHRKKRLTQEVITRADEALAPLWELCDHYSCTKTALALSFILSYANVSTVIPGIRTPQQVALNTTGLVKLKNGDRELIESLGKTTLATMLRFIQQQG
ncbi:MAG: aldo/keto reductase, partial [Chitinophagaceae bacterium]